MDGAGPAGGDTRPEDRPPLATPAGPRRWSVPGLVLTVVAAFALAVLATSALAVTLGGLGRSITARSPAEILLLTLATDGALLLAVATVGRRLVAFRAAELGLGRPTLGALRYGASFGAVLYVASIGVSIVQIQLFGAHPQDLVVAFGAHVGLQAYAIDLLNGGVLAPVTEEVFFRGLIFGGLAQRLPAPVAAAVSALLFALLHGLGALAPIFVLGLGLAYVYRRTGSLWASMVTHALVNSVSLTLLFLLRP